ncbi:MULTISPECIES: SpoIID/LytB domain-containing protein [Leptospira]|uniref:Stage II sporulation protein n=2 Tax=Leptospira kirschneri TaxID=29507 RepID=A0A1T1DN73_9LEPT|nr:MULTISPECIES: SpoIID/LytB domain-containing protein [Leptospira]EJO69129.1 stage II sporulation protein [Leptospira kirschneri serovar Grippotyphosa str. RM52]EKO51283.1 stage II sporulation protein [Leptospira kirschneri str. 200802841]EKP03201.1 stage II sporulation protein [Leptospira kirschneri str. 2008720114]EKQ82354.1 stage II sporulation protein [Leptospira kirschneri serovar Grippotyphosa str. Moskva]EKR07255.1 stage II sporulation protein [Leptospira kirschneri serovar Valbuzzi st
MTKKIILLFLLSMILLETGCNTVIIRAWTPPYKSRPVHEIRVLLGKAEGDLQIRGDGVISVYDANDLLIKKGIDIISLDSSRLKAPIRFVSQNTSLEFKSHKVRGSIHLIPQSQGPALVINVLPLEEYLLAVVPSEVPYSWPMEALKAQAICARTYAVREILNKKNALYDVEATTNSQVYGGIEKEHPFTTKAVQDTTGVMAVFEENPIQAFFHSNSGGKTETPENVWGGKKIPYLSIVPSHFDRAGENFYWKETVSQDLINSKFSNLKLGEIQSIQVLSRTSSGRVDLMELNGTEGTSRIRGKEFRQILGTPVRSLRFGIQKESNGFLIKGMGSGHGVGLSQWGSFGMAKENYNYIEILRYYYPGTDLARITR